MRTGSLFAVGFGLSSSRSRRMTRAWEIEPELKPRPAVAEKLSALKPNRAVLLGKKADVVGEFNDTAKKYDLHKTGPKGRDFHHQDVLGRRSQAGTLLRSESPVFRTDSTDVWT